MGFFNSALAPRGKSLEKNFMEFSDDIFNPERSTGVTALAQEFVQALEDGDFAQITSEYRFKVRLTEDEGLQLIFLDSEADEHKLYLGKDDSRLFFDELVAVREGLWKDVNLEDKVNNTTIHISGSIDDTYTITVFQGGKKVCDLVGTLGVIQKLEYYILYARYYK